MRPLLEHPKYQCFYLKLYIYNVVSYSCILCNYIIATFFVYGLLFYVIFLFIDVHCLLSVHRSHSLPVTFRARDFTVYPDEGDSDAGPGSWPKAELVTGTWTLEVILGLFGTFRSILKSIICIMKFKKKAVL